MDGNAAATVRITAVRVRNSATTTQLTLNVITCGYRLAMRFLASGAAVTPCALDTDEDFVARRQVEDNYSSLIQHRLSYATHNVDHVHLNPAQRMAIQHLREQLRRLLRKRDAYLAFIQSVDLGPMGLGKRPTPTQQDVAYELTQGFFEQVYATLSALASVHSRIRLYPSVDEAPIRSNEKFLAWWDKVNEGGWLTDAISYLGEARDYRTVFMHPAMWSLFDWRTVGTVDYIYVVLYGSQSSNGNIPPGSERSEHDQSVWEFIAPDMDAMLWSFEKLCSASFGPIFTWYPDDVESTCTWEPDGIGSSIGDMAAIHLREALASEALDSRTRSMLSPVFFEELDHYIDAMSDIRVRAALVPSASAIRTSIPAARASFMLPPPFGVEPAEEADGNDDAA